jgi:hypothetical protein
MFRAIESARTVNGIFIIYTGNIMKKIGDNVGGLRIAYASDL